MFDHIQKYAKAYSAGTTSGVTAIAMIPIGEKISIIVIWLITLTGVTPPDAVQGAIQYLLIGLVTGVAGAIAAARTANKEPDRLDVNGVK
jgi:hypothetical protein